MHNKELIELVRKVTLNNLNGYIKKDEIIEQIDEFIVLLIFKKEKPSQLLIVLMIFIAYCILNTIIQSPSHLMKRIECFIPVIFFGVFVEYYKDKKEDLVKGLYVLLTIVLFANLITILKYIGITDFEDGTPILFGNRNNSTNYYILRILVAYLHFRFNKKKIESAFC